MRTRHFMIIMLIVFMFFSKTTYSFAANNMIIGFTTHYAQNKHGSELIQKVVDAKAVSIRDEVYWSSVEKVKGIYNIPDHLDNAINDAVAHGISPLIILDYGNRLYNNEELPISEEAQDAFTKYAEFVVRHYKGKVKFYQVWNEWNIGFGQKNRTASSKGDPKEYARLLKKVYAGVKKIDPNALVLASSVARWDKNWIEKFLDEGSINYMDGLALNTYNYFGEKGDRRTPESMISRVVDMLNQLSRRYNKNVPIPLYITEVGWPNHTGPDGTSTGLSAAYLARLYLMASTIQNIKGVWWYDFQDDGTDLKINEHNFGLVRKDLTPKPSYYAFRDVAELVRSSDFVEKIASEPLIYALKFKNKDGSTTLALWTNKTGNDEKISIGYSDQSLKKAVIHKAGNGSGWTVKGTDKKNGELILVLDGTPLFVKISNGNVKIKKIQ